jgi:hypothetical protein
MQDARIASKELALQEIDLIFVKVRCGGLRRPVQLLCRVSYACSKFEYVPLRRASMLMVIMLSSR